jgi:hypothetical protein
MRGFLRRIGVTLLSSDPSTVGPFIPGASIDTPPVGDVERQAVALLRGYAYQGHRVGHYRYRRVDAERRPFYIIEAGSPSSRLPLVKA